MTAMAVFHPHRVEADIKGALLQLSSAVFNSFVCVRVILHVQQYDP